MSTHETFSPSPEFIQTIHEESARFALLHKEISKVIIGNTEIINHMIVALLCNGHVLLEGVPGVAKTTLVKSLTQALGLAFKRIQFTPDLVPADLIGTLIFNQKIADFETKKGPLFANFVLADEINRAPAKVQSALLEAMQEHQVTIGTTTFALEEPFIVFATQNPFEQEGTYRLPEAQVDRFMLKLHLGYPTAQEEKQIVMGFLQRPHIQELFTQKEILAAQKLIQHIYVDERIIEYIVALVQKTRNHPDIYEGASPRASLALHHAIKAHAFLKKRHFALPDDVKALALAVLAHRITVSYEAEASGKTAAHIIKEIIAGIPTP